MNSGNEMRLVHPGEILRAELDEIGLSANALSNALGVPVNRVTTILNGQRGVSADTALRLARFFGGMSRPMLKPARSAPPRDHHAARARWSISEDSTPPR